VGSWYLLAVDSYFVEFHQLKCGRISDIPAD
jgi:hypothetical protein